MIALKQNTIAEINVSYSNPIPFNQRVKISESKSAYKVLNESWDQDLIELQEGFKAIYLNRANQVLGIYNHSLGSNVSTVIDVKILLAVALKTNAQGIIVSHNHPSGNLKPSNSDISLTRKIKEASNLMEIQLLDHLIITKEGFFSFADHGLL